MLVTEAGVTIGLGVVGHVGVLGVEGCDEAAGMIGMALTGLIRTSW